MKLALEEIIHVENELKKISVQKIAGKIWYNRVNSIRFVMQYTLPRELFDELVQKIGKEGAEKLGPLEILCQSDRI